MEVVQVQQEMLIQVVLAEEVEPMVVQDLATVLLFLLLKDNLVDQETIMVTVVVEPLEQDLDLILPLGEVVQVLQLQLHHLQLHTQVAEVVVMALVELLVEQVVAAKVAVIDLTQVLDPQTLEVVAAVEVVSLLWVLVVIELMVLPAARVK